MRIHTSFGKHASGEIIKRRADAISAREWVTLLENAELHSM
jgi:hypothetical protein